MGLNTKPAAGLDWRFLAGGGEMGARIRAYDWASTTLGSPQTWPQGLRTAVRLMLSTGQPIFLFWGGEHICLYNDAYSASLGPEKHPCMLGAQGRAAWDEIWDIIGPQIDLVMSGGGATWHEDHLVPIIRNGVRDEVYWTYSYSPIDDDTQPSGVGGVLVIAAETTERVRAERRARLLMDLADRTRDADDPRAILHASAKLLSEHLGAAQVGYAEIDDAVEIATYVEPWTDGRMPLLSGSIRMDDYGPAMVDELRAGRTLVVSQVALDPRAGSDVVQAGYADISARAFVSVPLIVAGRLRAYLFVCEPRPRLWFDREVKLIEEIGARTWEAVGRVRLMSERKQAEAAQRESEARQAFILELGDRLRDSDDPRAVMAAAAEALGQRIGVSRVGYGEIEPDGLHIRYETCWTDGSVEPIIGVFPLSRFGRNTMAGLKSGQATVYADTETDPRIAKIGLAAVQARAAMAVPLVRDGKLQATLYLSARAVRQWSAEEVALVEAVAARMWAAVERARAEEALARQNKRLKLLTQIIGDLQLQGDAHGLLQHAFDTVAAEIGADIYFNFLLANDDPERLQLASSAGIDDAARAAFAEIRVGQYLCGRVAKRAAPIILSNVQDDTTEATSGVRALGVKCYAGFPLIAQGELLGTVAFCATSKEAFAAADVALIETISSQFAAAIARERLTAAMCDSESRFRAIADNVPHLAWMADREGNVDWFNKGWLDYTGTALEDNLGVGWKAVHHPDYVERVAANFERHLREKRDDWEDTFPLRGKDGSYRWFLSRMNAIRDETGEVVRFFGTNTDITASMLAEERQRYLTDELAHRGKNLLAVVQAIVSRSLSGGRSPAEARTVIEQRIQALARSQSTLSMGGVEGMPLAEAIHAELKAFSDRVLIAGPDVLLNARAAQTVALLVHELATNAVKYGALSLPGGRVMIDWRIDGLGADALFRFCWQERGGPPVTPPTRRGFGSVLFEKLVEQDFGVPPITTFAPEGLSYAFEAAVSVIVARDNSLGPIDFEEPVRRP